MAAPLTACVTCWDCDHRGAAAVPGHALEPEQRPQRLRRCSLLGDRTPAGPCINQKGYRVREQGTGLEYLRLVLEHYQNRRSASCTMSTDTAVQPKRMGALQASDSSHLPWWIRKEGGTSAHGFLQFTPRGNACRDGKSDCSSTQELRNIRHVEPQTTTVP